MWVVDLCHIYPPPITLFLDPFFPLTHQSTCHSEPAAPLASAPEKSGFHQPQLPLPVLCVCSLINHSPIYLFLPTRNLLKSVFHWCHPCFHSWIFSPLLSLWLPVGTWSEEGINEKALPPIVPWQTLLPCQTGSLKARIGLPCLCISVASPGAWEECAMCSKTRDKRTQSKLYPRQSVVSECCCITTGPFLRKQGYRSSIEQMSQQSVQPLHILPRRASVLPCYIVKKC